jgi:hypothetical protein
VEIARCGIDLLLAGHFHLSKTGHTATRYQIPGHSAIFVQAGTISTRGRGESNSFNAIRIDREHIVVERYACEPGSRFHAVSKDSFRSTSSGWIAE